MKTSTRNQLWLAAAIALGSARAAAQISFNSPLAYPTGNDPEAVAAADFDGDGDVDLAITLHSPARLGLLRNQGDGTFAAPEITMLAAGVDPAGLVARDFDGDGSQDVMIAQRGNGTVKYMHNLGDGHFMGGDFVIVGSSPDRVVAADFDGDGDDDIAVVNRGSSGVSFVRNLGGGDFAPIQGLAVGTGPRGLALGHFNGQLPGAAASVYDVVVACHDVRRLDVLHNQGDGHFNLLLSLPLGAGERPEDVAVGDFDGDGDDDIITSIGATTAHDIGIFYQLSPGVFSACSYFDVSGSHPEQLVVRDFDLDGRLDFAVVDFTSSTLSVVANLGNGSFGAALTYALPGADAEFVMSGDLDGNHYADLVVTNQAGDSVSVLLNDRDNPSSYCVAAPNSAGDGALMGFTGTASIVANDLTLQVSGAPASVNGFFFFGRDARQVPYFNGYLCVSPPLARLGPIQQTSALGLASRPLDFTVGPASMITDGSLWNFQFWYRDSNGGGARVNFSDGLRVVFEP